MRTIDVIASTIGTALIPTHGSCLPLEITSVDSPSLFTELPLTKMLEVGLSATFADKF